MPTVCPELANSQALINAYSVIPITDCHNLGARILLHGTIHETGSHHDGQACHAYEHTIQHRRAQPGPPTPPAPREKLPSIQTS